MSAVVLESGLSHRRFVERFREVVGLPPKLYSRVHRFRKALALLSRQPPLSLADVAFLSGYSDQPHFNRDFRELSGVTPEVYRAVPRSQAHHLPQPGIPPPGRDPK